MYDPVALRVVWNNESPATRGLGYRDLHVNPEPSFPFGRKGLAFQRAWEDIGLSNESVGMLILDGDVAIDPMDNRGMHDHIWNDPNSVWVAPARIWPVSHLGNAWTWGHGKGVFTQEDVIDPDMFSFCFTFLPAALMNYAIQEELAEWVYPEVDKQMWETARKYNFQVRVARDCAPKHMHY